MGNLEGAVKTKARLAVGSTVVFKKKTLYKGFADSPSFQDRLTVSGIFKTYITLTETPSTRYDIEDFFDYFTQVGK
jgi:hypothetical protein